MTPGIPGRLRPGDNVAVLSPSWGGPSQFPKVFELGLRNLREAFGVEVVEFPTTRMAPAALHANPELRAKDINEAFGRSEIRAIFASIGGSDSARILPFLDLTTILANPKILMGYSDTTALLSYLNLHGLITFHGPSIMAGWAQLHSMPQPHQEHLRAILCGESGPLSHFFEAFPTWSEGYPDWQEPTGRVGNLQKNTEGWQVLQGQGSMEGRLWGGCIDTLEMLKGTRFWPRADFWQGRVLFLETTEEVPSIRNVTYWLRNYGLQGIFSRISGILFGRARGYSVEMKQELDKAIVNVVSGEFGAHTLPIVANMDFGHTDPQFVMPLGGNVKLDLSARRMWLSEPVVI